MLAGINSRAHIRQDGAHRVAAVGPADELADIVAEHLLDIVGQRADQRGIEAEVLVFLLADPPAAVVERQAEAGVTGDVGSAAVPDLAVP